MERRRVARHVVVMVTTTVEVMGLLSNPGFGARLRDLFCA
jgi:hypothetical protein